MRAMVIWMLSSAQKGHWKWPPSLTTVVVGVGAEVGVVAVDGRAVDGRLYWRAFIRLRALDEVLGRSCTSLPLPEMDDTSEKTLPVAELADDIDDMMDARLGTASRRKPLTAPWWEVAGWIKVRSDEAVR